MSAAEHEFRYKRDDAQSVSVMSDFNGWKAVPMTKGSDGVWRTKVTLPAGTHGYKFLVNGTDWVMDPENSKRKQVDGVDNSAAEVTDSSAATTPLTSTPRPTAIASATPAMRIGATPSSVTAPLASMPAISPTPGELLITSIPLSEKR
ncbi:MAG TPA: isoamylase early set domain-containing protein, partial [Chthoniobacterales bacterium]